MKTGRAKKAIVADKWYYKYILNGKWEEEKQRNKQTNIKQRQQSENNKQINYINNDIECYGLNLQNFSTWSGKKATWSCEGPIERDAVGLKNGQDLLQQSLITLALLKGENSVKVTQPID